MFGSVKKEMEEEVLSGSHIKTDRRRKQGIPFLKHFARKTIMETRFSRKFNNFFAIFKSYAELKTKLRLTSESKEKLISDNSQFKS